jgi:hypothetical protein
MRRVASGWRPALLSTLSMELENSDEGKRERRGEKI